MENCNVQLEPAVKALAATAISQSLSFCMERKYLQGIENGDLFQLNVVNDIVANDATWIAINQVGRPIEKSAESCFTAIQKILYSCFLPKEMQLLFLVLGNEKDNSLYLGLRTPGKATTPKSMVRNLNEFVKGIWPGLQTEIVNGTDERLAMFQKNVAGDTFDEGIYALTGIPSMESQYKSTYPATIDKFIAGMNRCKNYAYMVVADPIDPNLTEDMLYQCREMNGQAESLKSVNITEGMALGTNRSHTEGTNRSHTDSSSVSFTNKDFSKLGKAAMAVTGLSTAASLFPAAGAILEGCSNAAGVVSQAALNIIGGATIGNFISGLMPQKTTTTTTSDTVGVSTSDTVGTSETKSQSLSRNIVNKHIERVSEHLYYHSQRLEQGKAIGLWKVGVYMMADKKSDLQGGALQLRSILSGHESIFEPIRVHDISSLLDGSPDKKTTYRAQSIGHFSAPVITTNTTRGAVFNHPLGDQYKELKTVLTTKELSYLINFPLRSVPGISVVDSSPEFSLNPQKEQPDSFGFGKMLYGGSLTEMEFRIPRSSLSRHVLLSGISGGGKTNTVKAMLNNIGKLPFLVIEPAKTEYVDWAIEYNKKHPDNPISIYIPGCKNYKGRLAPRPLKLNPFEIVWLKKNQEPNVLTHIDRLKSTFASAFPMYDILPVLMEDLIYSVYQNKSTDWLTSVPEFGKTLPPTLNSLKMAVDKVIENHQTPSILHRGMNCLTSQPSLTFHTLVTMSTKAFSCR